MSEENKAIVRRFGEEVWNKGNLEALDGLVTADFVGRGPGTGVIRGREELRQVVVGMRAVFPDLNFAVEDEIASGDKVVTRWTFRGTHQAEWRGVAPTGKQVTFTEITIRRIADGKIAEVWANADELGLEKQLGIRS